MRFAGGLLVLAWALVGLLPARVCCRIAGCEPSWTRAHELGYDRPVCTRCGQIVPQAFPFDRGDPVAS